MDDCKVTTWAPCALAQGWMTYYPEKSDREESAHQDAQRPHKLADYRQPIHRHLSENPTMSWYCPQINQNINIFRKSPHDIVLKPSKTFDIFLKIQIMSSNQPKHTLFYEKVTWYCPKISQNIKNFHEKVTWYCPQNNQNINFFMKKLHGIVLKSTKT